MNDRLQRALDGELSRDELTPAESAELDESTTLFAGVLSSIPAQPIPNLGAAVLRRVDAMKAEPPRWPAKTTTRHPSGVLGWLWSPRPVAIRPAYFLAAAAIIAIAIGVGGTDSNDGVTMRPVVATAPIAQEVLVHFRLDAPHARSVALAGNFSNWTPAYTLNRSEPGVWTIVIPLEPGVHDYSFVIDGEKWVPDPAAPARADGFGGVNSRIAVLTPDARRTL